MEKIIYERHIVFDTPADLIKEIYKVIKEDIMDILTTGRTDRYKSNKEEKPPKNKEETPGQ